MAEQPILETERLILRPFEAADAAEVQRLAGDRDVNSPTLNIPYPYEDGMAQDWISGHGELFEKGEQAIFAVTRALDGALVGAMDLTFTPQHDRAALGYWIGKPYWDVGYATEAVRAVLGYGFQTRGLNRIQATLMTRNPASGRVMQKAGMTHEGRLRKHIKKWDVFEDVEVYAMLREEFG